MKHIKLYEDLVRDIHDALRLMTNYAAGEHKKLK